MRGKKAMRLFCKMLRWMRRPLPKVSMSPHWEKKMEKKSALRSLTTIQLHFPKEETLRREQTNAFPIGRGFPETKLADQKIRLSSLHTPLSSHPYYPASSQRVQSRILTLRAFSMLVGINDQSIRTSANLSSVACFRLSVYLSQMATKHIVSRGGNDLPEHSKLQWAFPSGAGTPPFWIDLSQSRNY